MWTKSSFVISAAIGKGASRAGHDCCSVVMTLVLQTGRLSIESCMSHQFITCEFDKPAEHSRAIPKSRQMFKAHANAHRAATFACWCACSSRAVVCIISCAPIRTACVHLPAKLTVQRPRKKRTPETAGTNAKRSRAAVGRRPLQGVLSRCDATQCAAFIHLAPP